MDEIERKARELLAAEVFPEGGFGAELLQDMLIRQLGTVATEQALSSIRSALRSAQVPEGWVMVPREPTNEMFEAAASFGGGGGYSRQRGSEAIESWGYMIAAAPSAEGVERG